MVHRYEFNIETFTYAFVIVEKITPKKNENNIFDYLAN